jgi:myo-inositol 2-dehydrogenase/D-chiro-inositol 1-dehydrogenase
MRIGIIGTRWGLMHLGAFRQAGATVTALCGRDLEKTRQIASRENVELAVDQPQALIEAVDAVVVASPDELHADHALLALRAGRPVLCEKPLTRTWAQAERLTSHAGALLAVNFPYRQLAPLRALRRWLRDRPVRHLVVTVRNGFPPEAPRPERLGQSGDFGGVSHLLDAALWLAGSPADWISAALTGRPAHTALLQLGLRSGATLAVHQLYAPEPGIHGGWSLIGDGWEVGFSAGYLPARNGWCLSPVRCFAEGRWIDLAPGDEPNGGSEPWARAHVDTARLFLARLRGEPAPELATLDDGLEVQRLLWGALEADRTGDRFLLGATAGSQRE